MKNKKNFEETKIKIFELHPYMPIIEGTLLKIKNELDRLSWNKNQRELPSPFENVDTSYGNNTFMVRSYNWNGNHEPNFQYKGFKVWWYKYFGRGMYIETDEIVNMEFLAQMYDDCCKSLREDFNE